ncbi:hypothetical protein GUG52_13085, partial [Xanthomonas citri pv. citri]|nr:hypothetical protein [Xanthomonas citri pv. citri]
VDVDNSINIFNGVISDFLAGGATEYSARTEYGQPVEDDIEDIEVDTTPNTDSYYIAPAGYECIYSCEFFDNFTNGEYEYQFNFLTDNELVD